MKRLTVSRLLLRAGLNYQFRHRWQALLALIGITMGVSVVLAVDLANSAARASFTLSSDQLRGAATHRIVGIAGRLDQSLYVELFTSPKHPPMAPVIQTSVRIDGQAGRFQLLGLDVLAERRFREELPSMVSGSVPLGKWLSDPSAVALSASAARNLRVEVGSELGIRHQGKPAPMKVFAINEQDSLGSSRLLVVDIATAQAVTAMQGVISHIDLILDDESKKWIQQRLPASARLVDIDQQIEGIVGLSGSFELNLTAMSLLALVVGIFLIYNAMSFSIVQRRTLFGRLRALGVLSSELYRLVFAEALVLAVIGTLLGILLGSWLGQGITQIVANTVSELYYQTSADAMQIGGASLWKAICLGMGGTLLATWLPAYQAARTSPLTTLSRAQLERSSHMQMPYLAIAGLIFMTVGLIIAFAFPGGVIPGFVGLFVFLLGTVFMAPLSLPLMYRFLQRLPLRGVGRMAARDVDRHVSRLGTAASALMVALAASVGVAIMVDSMRGSVDDWLQASLAADLYIAAEGFEDGAFLPDEIVAQVPLIAGVGDVSMYRDHDLMVGGRSTRLKAARLAPGSRAGFDLVAQLEKPWQRYDQGEIFVSEPLAYRLGVKVGDTLLLATVEGDVSFRIAAIFRDYASEHGRVFLDLDRYQNHWQDDKVNTLALFNSDDDIATVYRNITGQLEQRHAIVVTVASEIYRESMAVFDRTFRITEVLRIISVMVAFVGIFSALMAVQLERRKEFAVLRALGLTRIQLSQLIITESVLLGLIAASIAIPVGLVLAWVLVDAIQLRAFGWSMSFEITWLPLLWTLILGLSASCLASLYPAWVASRSSPAPQLRED